MRGALHVFGTHSDTKVLIIKGKGKLAPAGCARTIGTGGSFVPTHAFTSQRVQMWQIRAAVTMRFPKSAVTVVAFSKAPYDGSTLHVPLRR